MESRVQLTKIGGVYDTIQTKSPHKLVRFLLGENDRLGNQF
jgi:hypothetical protein